MLRIGTIALYPPPVAPFAQKGAATKWPREWSRTAAIGLRRRLALLVQPADGKLAVADTAGQAFGVAGRRVFTVGGDELGERREQACLGQAVAVYSVQARLGPRLGQVAECCSSLFSMVRRRRDSRTRARPGTHDQPHKAVRRLTGRRVARAPDASSHHLSERLMQFVNLRSGR